VRSLRLRGSPGLAPRLLFSLHSFTESHPPRLKGCGLRGTSANTWNVSRGFGDLRAGVCADVHFQCHLKQTKNKIYFQINHSGCRSLDPSHHHIASSKFDIWADTVGPSRWIQESSYSRATFRAPTHTHTHTHTHGSVSRVN